MSKGAIGHFSKFLTGTILECVEENIDVAHIMLTFCSIHVEFYFLPEPENLKIKSV